jgi:hypothetical protein
MNYVYLMGADQFANDRSLKELRDEMVEKP